MEIDRAAIQKLVVVGEEKERSTRRPILAHEQERRGGRTQQQGRGRSIGGQIDLMMEPIAQCPVADLIVVLQTVDESTRRNPLRIGAPRLVPVDGMLTGVEPTFPNSLGQVGESARIIAIIAFAITRQEPTYLVMEIVG